MVLGKSTIEGITFMEQSQGSGWTGTSRDCADHQADVQSHV